MRRRSILGMFAAAPIAASVKAEELTTPSHDPPSSWVNSISPIRDVDEYDAASDAVKKAIMRRDAIRRLAKDGLLEDGKDFVSLESLNINSLKATSAVRKQQLQRDWRIKKKLDMADSSVERAIKLALIPEWMRRWC